MKGKRSLFRTALTVLCLCLSAVGPLLAKGASELVPATTVRMAVMQGPSGFASIGLERNDGWITDAIRVDVAVYPSPTEVIARLTNGELDIAALPTNVAANLYNKGVPIKVAATLGEGMLALVGIEQGLKTIEDLAGKTINIPGAGSTPDQMTRLLIQALGYDASVDVTLDYSVAAPAQLAQMLVAGKAALAVLPEPFVSMVLSANKNIKVMLDVQHLWTLLTGVDNYPMTVLVVSNSFRQNQPEQLKAVLDSLRDSVAWILANPVEAGALIEQKSIMKAALAIPAIPNCNLVYRPVKEGKAAVHDYLMNLYWFESQSIGGAIPDAAFYMDN